MERYDQDFPGELQLENFLDVTFNLCTGKYQPYNKPNDTPTYINVNLIR